MYLINLKNFTPIYQNSTDGGLRLSGPRRFAALLKLFLTTLLFLSVISLSINGGDSPSLNKLSAQESQLKCGTFGGTVYDLRTLDPLAGAIVTIKAGAKGDSFEARTGENGKYAIYDIPAATYTVKVSKEGYISDTVKLNLKKSYERYDTSIESERDYARKNEPDYERNINKYAENEDEDSAADGYAYDEKTGNSIKLSPAPAFSPKDNFNGVSGFYNLPDCSVMPYGAYRLSYGVQRSKRLSSPATPYVESNYSTALGYGLGENIEMSVFAFQHFSKNIQPMIIPAAAPALPRVVPPFYTDRTGISLKYAGIYKYKDMNQVFPYSLVYTHYNDGSDEVAIPIEIVSQLRGKFYFIPTYISRLGGNAHFNLAYYKPLFIDHRKLSYIMEFVQNDKHRWNIINAGFRLEFKNDSSMNLFLLSDSEQKRLSVGIGGTMLFK